MSCEFLARFWETKIYPRTRVDLRNRTWHKYNKSTTLKIYIKSHFDSSIIVVNLIIIFFYFRSIWSHFNWRMDGAIKMSCNTVHINFLSQQNWHVIYHVIIKYVDWLCSSNMSCHMSICWYNNWYETCDMIS